VEWRELKVEKCIEYFDSKVLSPPLKTDSLSSVQKSWERNLVRVYSLATFPVNAVHTGTVIDGIVRENSAKFPLVDETGLLKIIHAEIKNYEVRRNQTLSGPNAKELLKTEREHGFKYISLSSRAIPEGVEAWLSSQITGMWTAFESMAEDLWVTALNAKPKGLAELSGRRKRRPKEESENASSVVDEDGKEIKLSLLQKFNYDLSKNMGTILKSKYRFDRLDGIRSAYTEAFEVDSTKIDAIVADKALDALSLVRNNIVHNGGIVDQEYLRRKTSLPAEAIVDIGLPIPIDGELVSKLNRPAMKCGRDLIISVDEWLAGH
jgi:hypothetical protein